MQQQRCSGAHTAYCGHGSAASIKPAQRALNPSCSSAVSTNGASCHSWHWRQAVGAARQT